MGDLSHPAVGPLRIRQAIADDAETIARFSRALNEFLDEPTINFTAAIVRLHGFGPNRRFEALIAERDGAPVGYAAFHESYATEHAQRGLYLIDLYVAEAARRQGVGRGLLAAVVRSARARGDTFVWWLSKPWNEAAHAFYRSVGAAEEKMVAHVVHGPPFEALAAAASMQSLERG